MFIDIFAKGPYSLLVDLNRQSGLPALLVDVAHNILLVDIAVEANHCGQLAFRDVINVSAEYTTKV
jgi:hypothetical protein